MCPFTTAKSPIGLKKLKAWFLNTVLYNISSIYTNLYPVATFPEKKLSYDIKMNWYELTPAKRLLF